MIKIVDFTIQYSRLVYLLLIWKVDLHQDWYDRNNNSNAVWQITLNTAIGLLVKCLKHVYRWRAFGQSCQVRIKAAIQIFERLQTTTHIKFDLENWPQVTYWKQWLRLSSRTIEYATNTYKKYFYKFRINQSSCTYGKKKGTAYVLWNFQSKSAVIWVRSCC